MRSNDWADIIYVAEPFPTHLDADSDVLVDGGVRRAEARLHEVVRAGHGPRDCREPAERETNFSSTSTKPLKTCPNIIGDGFPCQLYVHGDGVRTPWSITVGTARETSATVYCIVVPLPDTPKLTSPADHFKLAWSAPCRWPRCRVCRRPG